MAGGIAILLVVIILLVGGAIAFSVYTTGGFLWWRKTSPEGDRLEELDDLGTRAPDAQEDSEQPRHTAPTTPGQEKTDFV